jgi:hypothetical protein
MRSTTVLASLLASTAVAQPFGHSNHRHLHEKKHAELGKRSIVTEWVTETAWQTVTEVVDESTTQYFTPTPTSSSVASTITAVQQDISSSTGGQFFEGSSSSSTIHQLVQQVATTIETPATPASVYVAPTSSTTPIYVAPVENTTPVEAVVQTTTTTPAAAATTTASSGSGGSGSTFSGDMTWYNLGLGSCGIDDSGLDTTTNIVAIASDVMGAASNGNPMCGKTITVSANGKTATALVHDKCPGCNGHSIDASEALFIEIFGDTGVGRGTVSWWFNE